MKRLFVLSLIAFSQSSCGQHFDYPTTDREENVELIFGETVHDPYRWLEALDSERVKTWAKQQERFLEDQLHAIPARASIKKRMNRLTKFDLYQKPQRVGKKIFYLETPAGSSVAKIRMQDGNGNEVIILDPEREFQEGTILQLASGLQGYSVSPDGRKLIYTLAKGQTRKYSAKIRDLTSGQDIDDELKSLHGLGGDFVWNQSSTGFYYVRFQSQLSNPEETPKEAAVYYHQIGSLTKNDPVVFKLDQQGQWLYNVRTSEEGGYLIIEARDGTAVSNRIYVGKVTNDNVFDELFEDVPASRSFLGNKGEELYFYTTHDAPNGRIVKFDLGNSAQEEVIPTDEYPIAAGSQVGGNAFGMFGDHFLLTYTIDAVPRVKCFELSGRHKYDVELPLDGAIWGGFSGRQSDDYVYYRFLGLTQPSTLFELSIQTGKLTIFKKAETGFKDASYVTKHVFYESRDGTLIPMFVTHKKGLKLDGSNPAFMYAYGAFNWISFLWYQPHLLVWLEMGGIYAQPSIRGGGEYGESWHQAGVGRNRQNAVDDYISATEWLIREGFTSPKKIVANGGSISSALAGNVLVQRPDLYGAVIIDRPALDMVRYDQFTTASYWVNELGSPQDSMDFKALFDLSPYHQLKNEEPYPPVLLMVGDQDEVTPPLHAYKFLAALQNLKAARQSLMLIKIMRETGHTFGSTPELISENRTDELAFLLKTMSLEVPSFND